MNAQRESRYRPAPIVVGLMLLVEALRMAFTPFPIVTVGRVLAAIVMVLAILVAPAVVLLATSRGDVPSHYFQRLTLRLLTWGGATTVVGLWGLDVGMLIYPESNLLGGLALIFGPISWLGCMLSPFALVGWFVAQIAEA